MIQHSTSQKDTTDYWDNAARDMVGYGIDLMRAIRAAQDDADWPDDEGRRIIPNLCTLCEIFTTLDQYRAFMLDHGAAPRPFKQTYYDNELQVDGTKKRVMKTRQAELPPIVTSPEIEAARREIEGGYWGLAAETQKEENRQPLLGTRKTFTKVYRGRPPTLPYRQ